MPETSREYTTSRSSFGMVVSMRQCSRPLCSRDAAATLRYDYAAGVVMVDPMSAVRDPHEYDMCAWHAGTLRAPHGWNVVERRVGMFDSIAVAS